MAIPTDRVDRVIEAITLDRQDRADRRRQDFRHQHRARGAHPHRRDRHRRAVTPSCPARSRTCADCVNLSACRACTSSAPPKARRGWPGKPGHDETGTTGFIASRGAEDDTIAVTSPHRGGAAHSRCHAGLGAGVRAGARGGEDRRRRYRLDDRRDRARAADDDPGTGAVLRRHGAQEERAQHHGDEPRVRADRLAAMGRRRLHARLHRRGSDHRHAGAAVPARHGHGSGEFRRQDHPREPVHDLPDDVRDHHGRARLGRRRRPDAILGLHPVRDRLAAAGLCAARPLGLGRRIPDDVRPPGLRRRHGRAHQCRHCRPGRRPGGRQAPRLRHGEFRALRFVHGGDRHRLAVGWLVRLQRRLRARLRIARHHGDRRHASRRLDRRPVVDGAASGRPAASRPCSA